MIDVREAGVQDVAAIAALFRDKRATCMPYSPAFHAPSEDLVFFGNCIEQETVWVVLRKRTDRKTESACGRALSLFEKRGRR
ncbi:MAG: hypothetical protein M3126_04895 [Candidatus Eremiobacteraeota bacterium]|nr:hypothetical protein [Candidatus Eremiobacteraeota bacterium]